MNNMNDRDLTKKMIATLKEGQDKNTSNKIQDLTLELNQGKKLNFLEESKLLMEQASKKKLTENADSNNGIPINKNTPHFGDIRIAQEESIKTTIGDIIDLDDNSLMFYPKNKNLVLKGKLNSLNMYFKFKFNDPTGDGCYIWASALQLTEANSVTLGKIRDAFMNWKSKLIQDADLIDKLNKEFNH